MQDLGSSQLAPLMFWSGTSTAEHRSHFGGTVRRMTTKKLPTREQLQADQKAGLDRAMMAGKHDVSRGAIHLALVRYGLVPEPPEAPLPDDAELADAEHQRRAGEFLTQRDLDRLHAWYLDKRARGMAQ